MEISFINGTACMKKSPHFTSAAIEKQILDYEYSRLYKQIKESSTGKRSLVEHTQYPPVNAVFYTQLFLLEKVPEPLTLLYAYYDYYSNIVKIYNEDIIFLGRYAKKIDLDARILRTYPSLLRDFHFYLLLVESRLFDEVSYSTSQDLEGKDIIVTKGERQAIVSLMVNTSRSRQFKHTKNHLRHDYKLPELALLLNLNDARQVGDFRLYREEDVSRVEYFLMDLPK